MITALTELDDQNLLFGITGITTTNFVRPYTEKLYIIDLEGSIFEINTNLPIHNQYIIHLRPWKDGFLFDVEYTWPENGGVPSERSPYKRCIIEVDKSLDSINSSCIISNGRAVGKAIFNKDSLYIIASNENVIDRTLLYAIVDNNSVRFERKENIMQYNYPSSIAYDIKSDNFLMYSLNGVNMYTSEFDLVQDLRSVFNYNSIYGHLLNLDDNKLALSGIRKLFVSGPGGSQYNHNLITLYVFDEDYNVMWADTLGYIPDDLSDDSFHNYVAIEKSIDTLGGFIFFAGVNQIDVNYLFSNTPNSIFIAKYDIETGETQWRYDQLNPDYLTILSGVQATSDGSCLLYGFRTDPATSIRYPYLLKLDADGTLSTSAEPEQDNTFRFTIYGNPSNELRFNISAGSDWQGRYQLIDMNGRIVLQESAQTGQHEASVNNLSAGMYIVLVMDGDGKVVVQRKWIKE